MLGVLLWLGIFLSGVHATLAGVLLAIVIPTRDPPASSGLLNQSTAAFKALEAPLPGQTDETRYDAVVRAMETVVERLLSPARRLERDLQPWSAYFVLPLVALANAGVELNVRMGDFLSPLSLGTVLGLVVGKPLGILADVRRARAASVLRIFRWASRGATCLAPRVFAVSASASRSSSRTPPLQARICSRSASSACSSPRWWPLRSAGSCCAAPATSAARVKLRWPEQRQRRSYRRSRGSALAISAAGHAGHRQARASSETGSLPAAQASTRRDRSRAAILRSRSGIKRSRRRGEAAKTSPARRRRRQRWTHLLCSALTGKITSSC